ncbi:MAG: ABC transporter permease [Dehalococcoidia bacterium]
MKGVAARGVSVWGGQRAPLRRVILYLVVTLVFGFLVLPNFIVVPLSVTDSIFLEFPPNGFTWRWYQDYFGVEGASHFGATGRWIPATLVSFQLAIVVMAVAVPLGTLAAYGLTRGRFRGKPALNAVIISPLIVPILITAIALFFFLSDALRSFFDPLPAPDLPSGPAIPDAGWLAFFLIMLALLAGTIAFRLLPNITERSLEGRLLAVHERLMPWFFLILVIEVPLFLLGLFVLLGEWVLIVAMLLVASGALMLMVLPTILRGGWLSWLVMALGAGLLILWLLLHIILSPNSPAWLTWGWFVLLWLGALLSMLSPSTGRALDARVTAIKDKVGSWVPIAFTAATIFFMLPLFSGLSDKLDGGLFTSDNPIPPVPGLSPGLVVSHSMLAVPYVVIILSATLRGVDVTLDQASATLGAGPFTTLRKVVLPVMIPGLAAAAFFSFLVSFDELLIALFLSTSEISTLPKEIWDGIRTEISPTIAAISTMLVFLTIIILSIAVVLQLRLKRRSGIVE